MNAIDSTSGANEEFNRADRCAGSGRGIVRSFVAGCVCTLAATTLQAGIIQYTYDDAGRLVMEDYGGGKRIAYTYDTNGNLLDRTTTVPANPPPPPPPSPPPPNRSRGGGGGLDLFSLLALFGSLSAAAAFRRQREPGAGPNPRSTSAPSTAHRSG